MRKGGFEPPRLSAPPPQDGVSANSTTSARCTLLVINSLASSSGEGVSYRTGFCTDFLLDALFGPLEVCQPLKQLVKRTSRGHTKRIMVLMLSCPATYCKGIRVLSLSEKYVGAHAAQHRQKQRSISGGSSLKPSVTIFDQIESSNASCSKAGVGKPLTLPPILGAKTQRCSNTALRYFQKFATVEICTRSCGLCGSTIVGPNDAICIPGYFSPITPHSKPACIAISLAG